MNAREAYEFWRAQFAADEKTLAEQDIREVHQGIINALRSKLNASLRDS